MWDNRQLFTTAPGSNPEEVINLLGWITPVKFV